MVVFTRLTIREYGFPSSCRTFDGGRLQKRLLRCLPVRLGLVGQVFVDEELGHFLPFRGEGGEDRVLARFRGWDACGRMPQPRRFHRIFIVPPSQLPRNGRSIRR